MSLIPVEQLRAARERYERQQSDARAKQLADDRAVYERQQAELAERASAPVPTEKRPYVYVPRTAEQWAARVQQGRRDGRRRWTKTTVTKGKGK
jgi:hypothetical protein